MSYDPYSPDAPPPPPEPGVDLDAVRRRVQLPAIFLIALGVLNLLLALYQVVTTVWTGFMPAKALVEQQQRSIDMIDRLFPNAGFKAVYAQQMANKTPEDVKTQALVTSSLATAIMLLTALLPLIGGVRMLKLRSYGLAVVGSITIALPCLSLSGCLCGVGQVVGIWAVIVLLNPDVRASFH
jgi:hypothetical protein